MAGLVSTFLIAALALLLVSAGLEDIRTREIANWKNAAIALLAIGWWWSRGLAIWPDMVLQFGAAALVFALFAGAFFLGMMGGGDVKMIGALALWLPLSGLLPMLVVMSLVGGVITLAMLIEKRVRRSAAAPEIPYGVAIAIAGLLALPRTEF